MATLHYMHRMCVIRYAEQFTHKYTTFFLNLLANNLVRNYVCWQWSKGGTQLLIFQKKGLKPILGESSWKYIYSYNTLGTSHNKTKILFDGQLAETIKIKVQTEVCIEQFR